MGWWWSSSPQTPVSSASPPPLESIPTPPDASKASEPLDKPPTAQPSTPQTIEQELAQFIPGLAASSTPEPPAHQSAPTTRTPQSTQLATGQFDLFPDTMSCRAAFDSAFACKSISGQVLNLYRYGEWRECSDNWAQFWWCMRNRRQPEERKRELVREWYREREERRYGPAKGRGVEEVWEVRTERLGRAFDEEWEGVRVELEDTRGKARRDEEGG